MLGQLQARVEVACKARDNFLGEVNTITET